MPQNGTRVLHQFCGLLTGKHSNQQQAFDNPPLFAHIILKYRVLPQFPIPTLLLEQGYAVNPDEPYRVRVLQISINDDKFIRVINHKLHNQSRFKGASEHRLTRDMINAADLDVLEGCAYDVHQSGPSTFIGTTEPGCRCFVHRNGVQTYLESSFQIHPGGMKTLDRGYDLKTQERVWGSVAGEFNFRKEDDWSEEMPPHWWRDS